MILGCAMLFVAATACGRTPDAPGRKAVPATAPTEVSDDGASSAIPGSPPSPSPTPTDKFMLTSPFPLTGEYIVTANADNRSLSVVPVGLASVAATVPLPSAPGAIATAPNSDRVFVATPAEQALALASLNAGQVVATSSADSHPDQLMGPPPGVDGPLLVLSETDRTIRSLDPASQAFGPAIELGPGPHAIAMATARPASVQQIYVTSAGEGRLDLLDAQATTLQRSLGVGGRPIGVTATSTGQLWIADASEGSVKQIDPSSGQTIQAIPVGQA
jgi:DNA-binding beta-propeller fold protein YncE